MDKVKKDNGQTYLKEDGKTPVTQTFKSMKADMEKKDSSYEPIKKPIEKEGGKLEVNDINIQDFLIQGHDGDALFLYKCLQAEEIEYCYNPLTESWLKYSGSSWDDVEIGEMRTTLKLPRDKYWKECCHAVDMLEKLTEKKMIAKQKIYIGQLLNTIKGLGDPTKKAKILQNGGDDKNLFGIDLKEFLKITLDKIACNDTVIDVVTGKCIEDKKQDYICRKLPIDFLAPRRCKENIDDFFNDLFLGRRDIIEHFRNVLKHGLTGRNDTARLFILYGPRGSNGKTTLTNMLHDLLGGLYGTFSPKYFTIDKNGDDGNKPDEQLMNAEGKRIINMRELVTTGVLDIEKIKHLTGGGAVAGRILRGHLREFDPEWCIFMETNNLPKLSKQDVENVDAIKRRFEIIPFEAIFKENPNPKKKNEKQLNSIRINEIMTNGLPELLDWILEGEIFEDDYESRRPAYLRELTTDYFLNVSPFERFLRDCCIFEPKSEVQAVRDGQKEYTGDMKVLTPIVWAAYQNWCQKYGEDEMGKIKFFKKVDDRTIGRFQECGHFWFWGMLLEERC